MRGKMAICFSSSAFLSSPSVKPSSLSSTRTPFVGLRHFAVAAKPPLGTPLTKRLQIRCRETAIVPDEQRWMFEDDEINGPDIWNKTWYPKAADHITTKKTWYIVDATDKILGRLASTIAVHIRGKNLATFTPSVDMGAYVIVVNAEKIAVSGKNRTHKLYRRHSGRPGGMKVETFHQLQQRNPERIIEPVVRNMLPKTRLGRALFHPFKGVQRTGASTRGPTTH